MIAKSSIEKLKSLQFELAKWLSASETVGEPEAIFNELNERLLSAGMQLHRASCGLSTMHPEVFAKQLIWEVEKGAYGVLRSHEIIDSEVYRQSPPAYVTYQQKKLHLSLEGPRDQMEYEICRELKQLGATDYLILPMPFRNGINSFISWSTTISGGFGSDEVELLEAIVPWISLRLELESARFATSSLLRTYLGENAAHRVLSGEFKKGSGEMIHAVIWSCDLRGFTERVDSNPLEVVLHDLDQYFSFVAKPIMENGGEVLKYIGDAVLGVFPFINGEVTACTNALRAAAQAFLSKKEQSALCHSEIQFGVALHVGKVMFGNIGAEGRLDFTVIGSAVNEVCRVEAMCKDLGQELIVTQSFIDAAQRDDATSLGTYKLRGVEDQHELYTFDISKLDQELI